MAANAEPAAILRDGPSALLRMRFVFDARMTRLVETMD
jgi:hypothetical protein